jgi:hypothetical protein
MSGGAARVASSGSHVTAEYENRDIFAKLGLEHFSETNVPAITAG